MAINKDDTCARHLWGDAYDAIPKSVFAACSYFLAQICSEEYGGEIARMIKEVEALGLNQIISDAQSRRCVSALRKEL